MNVEEMLAPVSPEAPCGEDLEYGAVAELDRSAQIVPEQQMGDTVVPEQEPDWGAVRRHALELCGQTKDLRVAVILLNAATRTDGWQGFVEALRFLDGLLERYWSEVHPTDPDEPDDFTMRVNVIASLADGDGTLAYLRAAPLIESVMGRFSLRDILVAEGELAHPDDSDESAPERQMIDAAVRAAEAGDLEQVNNAVVDSAAALGALEGRLLELVGPGSAPDLSPLSALLARAKKALGERFALRPDAVGEPAGTDPQATAGGLAEVTGQPAEARTGAGIGGAHGSITGPDDVRRALEAICAYYRRHEPSSPIPILLERALRLISKDFEALIKNLAPDGLGALEQLRGPMEESNDADTAGNAGGTSTKSSGW